MHIVFLMLGFRLNFACTLTAAGNNLVIAVYPYLWDLVELLSENQWWPWCPP